jgi:hypothetical protein
LIEFGSAVDAVSHRGDLIDPKFAEYRGEHRNKAMRG